MPTDVGQQGPGPSVQTDARSDKLRDVVITSQFKRDVKRELKGVHRSILREELQAVVDMLADDIPLPARMVDHPLGGTSKHHRDCHVRPDLVLIYRKSAAAKVKPPGRPDKPKLHLVHIGSHSELGI